MSAWQLQAVKHYGWPVLRLSILIAVVTLLIVNTLPAVYTSTATLQEVPHNTDLLFSSEPRLDTTKVAGIYQQILRQKLADAVSTKLKSFRLSDIDNELKKILSGNLFIAQIKQNARSLLPFMPQQAAPLLSPKQIENLKKNYTASQINQNLQLDYSSKPNEVRFTYQDQHPDYALIIVKLAADLYLKSTNEIPSLLSEQFAQQSNNTQALANTADSLAGEYKLTGLAFDNLKQLAEINARQAYLLNMQSPQYHVVRSSPDKEWIIGLSFIFSLITLAALVTVIAYPQYTQKAQYLLPESIAKTEHPR